MAGRGLVCVWLAFFLTSAVVEVCRSARRRHTSCHEDELEKREEIANLVLTGTVQRIYRANRADSRIYRSSVHVKRVLKGDSNLADNTVIVEGFGDPHICYSDVREKDTRIFLLNQMMNGKLRLNSSLVRININSLHRTFSAVHDGSGVEYRYEPCSARLYLHHLQQFQVIPNADKSVASNKMGAA